MKGSCNVSDRLKILLAENELLRAIERDWIIWAVQLLHRPGMRDTADEVIRQLGGTPLPSHIHTDKATQKSPPNCS